MKRRNFISLLGLVAAPIPVFANSEIKRLTELEQFAIFFEKLNGFPLSVSQQDFTQAYFTEGSDSYFYSRNWGKTTLLVSLSLWELQCGKKVIYCGQFLPIISSELKKSKNTVFEFEHYIRKSDAWRGRNYDRIFYDFEDLWPKYDVLKPAVSFNKGILVGGNCILKV